MRPIRALVIYFILVFFGGALLAPWLWRLAQVFSPAWPGLAHAPFHRFLDRAILILALAGIWPLMRSLGAVSWKEIGLPPPNRQGNRLWGGLLLGLFSLALAAGIEIGTGTREFDHGATAQRVIKVIFSAMASAVVVGVLEEILFRGAIFGGLRRVIYWPFALAFSSLIFAFVHFLSRADIAPPINWDTGLILLPHLFDIHAFIPEFLVLTFVGVLLGLAYQRTGNLYFSIGLHSGWVFVLRVFGPLTTQSSPTTSEFWGSGKMIDGWLAFLALVLTLVIFQFLPLEKQPPYTISK